MKRFLLILCLLPTFGMTQICSIDYSQTAPGIYPDTLPTGYVGAAYDEDISFVLPLDTMGYDFLNFHILSIALPVGLSWECDNSANNCNYDPQVSQYGCVNVYGTPLLAGQYQVDVTVIADLTIAAGLPTTFSVFLEILPSNVPTSNTGFSMVGASGCFPLTVGFTNNNPGLLAYAWDFGNGNQSTTENPSPQVYSAPGDYVVTYSAWDNLDTIHVYTLTDVAIQSMSGYGEGFPSYEAADSYYIILENGSLYSQSSIIANVDPPVSWTTSLLLDPANTYTLEIWESDATEPLLGADDFMGSATMNITGCTGCAAGTATVDYIVDHVIIYPAPSVVSVDTVHVNDYPTTSPVIWDSLSNTVCTNDDGFSYQWYFNGSPIAGATDTCHVVENSGDYFVVAINTSGCVAFSDTVLAIYCSPAYIPDAQINGDGNLIVTNPIGAIQWFLDGAVITGDTLQISVPNTVGSYHVEITDAFGCVYSSAPVSISAGLEASTVMDWSIYPNPAKNELIIRTMTDLAKSVELLDLGGRTLIRQSLGGQTITILDLGSLGSGCYIVKVYDGDRAFTKKLIVQK